MISENEIKTIIGSIRTEFKSLADPSYAKGARKIISDEDRVIGVRVPAIKSVAREFLKEKGKKIELDDLLTLADECFKTEGREEQLFAVFVLSKHLKKMDRDSWQLIDNWVDYISNSETCDQLATQFAGKILLSNIDLITDLKKWAGQTNVWRRRFAAAATVALNRGGHSNPAATFEVLRPLVSDNNDMVRKAVAWAIREASKADEESAFRFLMDIKETAVPHVIKYGSEKLSREHRELLGINE